MSCYSPLIWPDPRELKCLIASLILLTLIYTFCLVLTVHNVWRYLIKLQKYKIKLVLVFYAIALVLVVSRIASLVFFICFYDSKISCNDVYKADLLDTTATYVKALLGVQ